MEGRGGHCAKMTCILSGGSTEVVMLLDGLLDVPDAGEPGGEGDEVALLDLHRLPAGLHHRAPLDGQQVE